MRSVNHVTVSCYRSRALSLSLVLLISAVEAARALDVTERLVDLGNKPAESRQKSINRNVWDLQAYERKLFIGMGSTVMERGPIPIWAFDHDARSWDAEPEAIIDQEAIDLYRVIDGRLYIPAIEPKQEATEASKFYRRGLDGSWTHFFSDNSLKTAHIRDLAAHDGLLIGVGNSRRPHDLTRPKPGAVSVPLVVVDLLQDSDRELLEFRSAISLLPPVAGGSVDADTSQRNRMANWLFSIFRLHDGLYASTRWLTWAPNVPEPVGIYANRLEHPPLVPPFPSVVRWDSSLKEWVAPDPNALERLVPESPERNGQLTLKPYKPVLFGDLWFAPLRSHGLTRPFGLSAYGQSVDFVVKAAGRPASRVVLPDAEAIGAAVLVHDKRLFVLANVRRDEGGYRVLVYALDPEHASVDQLDSETGLKRGVWQEVLSFQGPNLARSFARIDDSWYFGLGADYGEPVGQAGALLRYAPANDPARAEAQGR